MDEPLKISVCLVCIHLLANGEFNDGTDAADVAGSAMAVTWSGWHLVPGNEEHGYCTSSCGGCGDTLHGDRFEAFAFEVR
jgi:hypothetical protein